MIKIEAIIIPNKELERKISEQYANMQSELLIIHIFGTTHSLILILY